MVDKKNDTVSDQAPTPKDVNDRLPDANPGLGEKLASEAVDKRDNGGGTGNVKKVEDKNGNVSWVREVSEDKSDNGKTYSDSRIVPSDTNAPDAGLTPDGRRIAN